MAAISIGGRLCKHKPLDLSNLPEIYVDVRRKLEWKEFRTRCLAENMCPECGDDLTDTVYSYPARLVCDNEDCNQYNQVLKREA